MSPNQAASKGACTLRQTFRKEHIVAALVIFPTAALPLIRCLCKSWCVIYQAEYHNTEEVYCPLHSQPCMCMGWGLGFLSCWVFYSKRYTRFGFFSPYVIFTKVYYERDMFVCIEECFVAGIWNLNFLVSSLFLVFLGPSLSRTVLIPIRCFNHVLRVFFSHVGIGVHHFTEKQLS